MPRGQRQTIEAAGLPPHVAEMGFASVGVYFDWCRRSGMEPSLRKARWQREEERALRAGQQTVTPEERMRRSGARAADVLLDLCRRNAKGAGRHPAGPRFSRAVADHGLRHRANKPRLEALRRLVRKVFEESSRSVAGKLLDESPVCEALGRRPGNTYLEALVALAASSADWVRPVEDYRPRSRSAGRYFESLVDHLFVRYAPPAVLRTCWFEGAGPEAAAHRAWFAHAATGRSVRECRLPLPLSRKAAHAFTDAPPSLGIAPALRWAQVRGAGGSERLAEAVAASRIGGTFGAEDFWSTVVDWFCRQPMFDADHVGPVIDYLHEQRFVEEVVIEDGVRRGRIPQPRLSMAGRTPESLLRQVDAWHLRLARRRRVYAGRSPVKSWPPCGLPGFLETTTGPDGKTRPTLKIVELRTSADLAEEGRAMRHCVATYAGSCAGGRVSIWSLLTSDGSAMRRRVTVEVRNESRSIVQVRGRLNRKMKAAERDALRRWASRAGLTLAKTA